jgi:hypothetical protein
MDGLLHWDFSPGLALEDQVRHRFGSLVHFSPSPKATEFFLVVSFSSASFPLTEESVGFALQCCIGGIASRFKVYKLSDRRFRFSVASNKVGNFIYGLKDRIWPDFICHFSLFRGIHPRLSGFTHDLEKSWISDDQDLVIAQCSPTKLRPRLDVLRNSAASDQSGASALELAKFGFINPNSDLSQSNYQKKVTFGSFSDPIILDHVESPKNKFVGLNFQRKLCEFLHSDSLLKIQDLRQAGYSDPDIMDIMKIPIVPQSDLISSFIPYCSKCGLNGHVLGDCKLNSKSSCFKCLAPDHNGHDCHLGWRCKRCKELGHVARSCSSRQLNGPTLIWREKIWLGKRIQTKEAGKIWVVKRHLKGEGINLPNNRSSPTSAVSPPLSQTHLPQAAAMANFPVNLLAFLPEGMTVDHGLADRKVRTDLVVSPNAPLQNDKVLIAETNRFIPIHLRHQLRHDLRNLLEEGGYRVSPFDDHPFGLGSYTFDHTLMADTVRGLTYELD